MKFKGESAAYRKLRDELLEAEIALKDQRERVASLRRRLPMSSRGIIEVLIFTPPSGTFSIFSPKAARTGCRTTPIDCAANLARFRSLSKPLHSIDFGCDSVTLCVPYPYRWVLSKIGWSLR